MSGGAKLGRPCACRQILPASIPVVNKAVHRHTTQRRRTLTTRSAAKQDLYICVNKTCKSQGSVPIAQFAEDLGLTDIHVERTGCQGKCGSGPNLRLEPGHLEFNHVSTPAKLARLLEEVCHTEVSPQLLKVCTLARLGVSTRSLGVQATELRSAGVAEARAGNLPGAVNYFTQALEAQPPQGRHLILANRSASYRSLGQYAEAAADADGAVACAPPGFSTAYIRQVEAYSALEDYQAAMVALDKAAEVDTAFAVSRDYKDAKQQLQPLLQAKQKRKFPWSR